MVCETTPTSVSNGTSPGGQTYTVTEYGDGQGHELIQAWGTLGYSWGLNKTMAQIHALLMISTKPLSTEEIYLGSRGRRLCVSYQL